MKRARLAAAVLGAAFLLLVVLVVILHLSGFLEERARRAAQARAALLAGAEVRVERLRLRFYPAGARLEGITFTKDDEAGDRVEIRAPLAEVRASFLSLGGLRRGPVHVTLERPVVVVTRRAAPAAERSRDAPGTAALLAAAPAGSTLLARGAALTLIAGAEARADLRDVEVRLRAADRAARGTIAFAAGEARVAGRDWHGLSGGATLHVVPEGVRFEPLEVRSAAGRAEARGMLRPGEAAGKIEADIDLARAPEIVAGAQAEGRVRARLDATWKEGVPRADGSLETGALRLWGVPVDALRSAVEIEGSAVRLRGARAELLGGSAAGSAAMTHDAEGRRGSVEVRVDGVDLARVLALGGWAGPPVRGTLHYNGRHEFSGALPEGLGGSGVIDAVGRYLSPRGADLPLEVTTTVQAREGALHLRSGTLAAGSTRATFSGTVRRGDGIRLRLRGATGDLSEILPLFRHLAPAPAVPAPAPAATPAPAPPRAAVWRGVAPGVLRAVLRRAAPARWSAAPPAVAPAAGAPAESALERIVHALGGAWEWQGDLHYGEGGMAFTGTLKGKGLTLAGVELGTLDAAIRYADERLEITSARLGLADGGDLTLDGRIDFRGAGAVGLEVAARDYPIGPFLSAAGIRVPLDGRFSGHVSVGGRPAFPSGRASLEASPVRVAGMEFDALVGDVVFTPDLLEADNVVLMQSAGTVTIDGALPYRDAGDWIEPEGAMPRGLRIAADAIDLSLWAGGGAFPLAGTLTLEGRIGGSIQDPKGDLVARAADLRLRGGALGPAETRIEIAAGEARFRATLAARGVALEGRVAIAAPYVADLQATFDRTPVQAIEINPAAPDDLRLTLSGTARVRGPLADRRALEGSAELSALRLEISEVALETPEPISATFSRQRLTLPAARLTGTGTEIRLRTSLDARPGGALDAEAGGRFDLRLLRVLRPDVQATGRGDLSVRLEGTLEAPLWEGTLDVEAEAVRHEALPFPVDDLRLRAAFDRARLRVERLDFNAGGGPVQGSGEVLLGEGAALGAIFKVREAGLRFHGTDVRSEFPEGFRSVADLDLELRHAAGATTLDGWIEIVRGTYARDFRLESIARRGAGDLFTVEAPPGPLADLRLDLVVRAARDVWLRNDFGTVEGEGEIRVTGTAARPSLAGRIAFVEGGTIRFRQVPYRVQGGSIDFADPQMIDPIFSLLADTRVGDYEVILRLEGTLGDFRYELTSDPPLPQQDIVALLLTGRTLGTADEQSGEIAEETVSSYLAGQLTGQLTERVGGRTGLDLLAIDPLQVGAHGDPTARVTLGKQVAPSLFVTYSSDLGSDQGAIYQLDYAVARDFTFTSVRDRDGSLGVDFKYILRGRLPGIDGGATRLVPRLRAVVIAGDPRFPDPVLRRRLRLRAGRPRDRAAVNAAIDRLLQFYRDRGHLMADVDDVERPAGEGAVDLHLEIDAGPRVAIAFDGASVPQDLRREVETQWHKGLFLEDIVAAARSKIIDHFRDLGFLGVQVDADVLEDTAERFQVVFRVRRGPRVRAREVRVEGAREIPPAEVLAAARTRRDTLFSRGIVRASALREDAEAMRRLYMERGFPAVSVTEPEIAPPGADGIPVVFRIEEGPRITIQAVRFEGNRAFAAAALDAIAGLVAGAPYSPGAVDAAIVRLRRAYDDAGYPDARVEHRPLSVARDEPSRAADVVLLIDEGALQKVGRVEIAGTVLTRERVVRKTLTFKAGSRLSRRDLLDSQTRLYRRGIFRSVSVDALPPDAAPPPDGAPPAPEAGAPVPRPVRIEVREAAPITQIFGIGYDSEEHVRALYEISNRNVRGSGRHIGLQARGSDLEQRAALSFREFGLFGGRYDALASTFWEDEERPAFDVRTVGSSVQISRRFTRATRTQYRYSLRDVDLSDASATFDEGTTLRLAALSASAVHDTRDALFDPRRGHYLSGEVQVFGRGLGSEAEFTKSYAQFFFFREALPGTVWAQALRAGVAVPFGVSESDPASTGDALSGLPPSERFFAGGDTTLRGFRRDRAGPLECPGGPACPPGDTRPSGDPIGGEALFIFNQELRFPIWRFLQGVVFYDAGNVFRLKEDFDLSDLRHVAGAGLRIATPIGPFRLEYGALLDRQEGERRGEFFLSIGQAF